MYRRIVNALLLTTALGSVALPLSAQQPREGGVVRVGIQSEPRSLDPLLVITDGATGHVVSNIFNTLVVGSGDTCHPSLQQHMPYYSIS